MEKQRSQLKTTGTSNTERSLAGQPDNTENAHLLSRVSLHLLLDLLVAVGKTKRHIQETQITVGKKQLTSQVN